MISSTTGMQQGDPLGSLLFSITIYPILECLRSELILGYLDDLTIMPRFTHYQNRGWNFRGWSALKAVKCKIVTAAYNANDFSTFKILAGFQIVDIRDAQLFGSPMI